MTECRGFREGLRLGSIVVAALLPLGCMSAAQHQQSLHSTAEREMTVGVVQKEIRVGMSQADVAQALGSPNIVTRDADGKEAWVYDKIATEASYSSDRGEGGAAAAGAVVPGSSLLLGGLGGSYGRQAGAYSSTQKTLTVVIKFDAAAKVESFSYHASKF